MVIASSRSRRRNGEVPFHLDTTSRKVGCPRCGHKTFVNYLYADNSTVGDGECGKCDRKDNCGYECKPREYLSYEDYMKVCGHQPGETRRQTRRSAWYVPKLVEVRPSFINKEEMEQTRSAALYAINPLAIPLHRIFDDKIGAETVNAILRKYAPLTHSRLFHPVSSVSPFRGSG